MGTLCCTHAPTLPNHLIRELKLHLGIISKLLLTFAQCFGVNQTLSGVLSHLEITKVEIFFSGTEV